MFVDLHFDLQRGTLLTHPFLKNPAASYCYSSSGYGVGHTLISNPISSYYPHYFKNYMNKTYVRGKNNLNSIGDMPLLGNKLNTISF